jgi:hypothetical protein
MISFIVLGSGIPIGNFCKKEQKLYSQQPQSVKSTDYL